jgi:hypothetical protein
MHAADEWPMLNHKGRLRELGKLLTNWTARRVRAVYNSEQGVSLRAEEQADITALTDKENQDDFMALQARVSRLEAALAAVDEAFFDPQVAAYRQALHGGRREDVTSTTEGE